MNMIVDRPDGRIIRLRGQYVILAQDLAGLYQAPVKSLIQAVKRNLNRFPPDFMFQLSPYEFENLKSQIVTSSWGGLRRAVLANRDLFRRIEKTEGRLLIAETDIRLLQADVGVLKEGPSESRRRIPGFTTEK